MAVWHSYHTQAHVVDSAGSVVGKTNAFVIQSFPAVGQAATVQWKVPADLPAGTYYLKANPSALGDIYAANSQAITVK